MQFQPTTKLAATLLLGACIGGAQAGVVYSNNPAPGDAFTNPTTVNTGQAVGASGWYYNNVRNNGVVGINTTYPRSGNGSVFMQGPQGPGGASSKGDIEYLANAVADPGGAYVALGSLGLFTSLVSMSYDWYRDGSSTNSAAQHPSLRVLIDIDGNTATLNDRSALIFEAVYNGVPTAPTNTWVSEVIGASTKLWSSGSIGFEFDIDGDGTPYDTLAEWQASGRLANAVIVGFSSGFGSGWGPFTGAVDNIGWTIGNVSTSTNFEVQAASVVPEPGSIALVALALGLAAGIKRRRS